jgi:hypothetical protein
MIWEVGRTDVIVMNHNKNVVSHNPMRFYFLVGVRA